MHDGEVDLCARRHKTASTLPDSEEPLNADEVRCKGNGKGKAGIAVHGTPSHSYGVSLAIWDHTRHK